MDQQTESAVSAVQSQFQGLKLPRWAELPDLELYMDQVLSLTERFLGDYPGFDGRGLTASMVNNYVKLGVMPKPVKKRYTREHLAYLIMICVLKASLPMGAIRALMARETAGCGPGDVYDRFCDAFERAEKDTAAAYAAAASDAETVFRAALRARAEQGVALRLSAALEKKN